MRVASKSGIVDIIDKLHEDEAVLKCEDADGASSSSSPRKPSRPRTLYDMHPTSIDSGNAVGVVVNSILMFRDRFQSADTVTATKILERLLARDGTVSNQSAKSFHLNFTSADGTNNIRISVYDTYIEFSDKKWYLRIHVTFPEHGLGKMHIFPLIDVKSGMNYSHLYWNDHSNEPLCQSNLPEDQLMPLLIHIASIEYNIGLKRAMVDVMKHTKTIVGMKDYSKIEAGEE